MESSSTRGGAPGSGPVSGCPCPRLHQSGSPLRNPRRAASVVTKMTPVRGTVRKAENDVSSLISRRRAWSLLRVVGGIDEHACAGTHAAHLNDDGTVGLHE